MSAGAWAARLEDTLSVKTFTLSLAVLFALMFSAIGVGGFLGEAPPNGIEKTLSIPGHDTVAVNSGDLNQLDITAPPPKPKPEATTEAGKPQPKKIETAVAGLHEETPQGLVPMTRKEDGLTPFKAYAATFTPDPSAKALVSFVMMDFGLSDKTSQSAITDLPQGVSFVLDAYTKNAQKWTDDARKFNHEIWLSLPLQTKDYPKIDTGPKTILTGLSDGESNTRLLQTLSLSTGYVGVIADNASAYSAKPDLLQKILASVADRGLGIIQSDPSDRMLGQLAAKTKAPFAHADTWIDQVNSEKTLQAKFIDIESMAVKNKKLVVFFHPYPATLKALKKWSTESANRGIQLAPLSAVVSK